MKHQMKRVLSLFSGCGGMDLGIEGGFEVLRTSINTQINPHWAIQKVNADWVKLPKTTFETAFANDIKLSAKIAWDRYFIKRGRDDNTFRLASIVDLVKAIREGKDNIFPENIDVVTGGFPCQDFSVSGKRKGFSSDKSHTGKRLDVDSEPTIENRGNLYIWMKEVISIVKPKLFIAENVKGLVNLDDTKQIIESDFRTVCDNGYIVVDAKVLHAGNYGVPQNRERVIFFGFLRSALKPEAIKALTSEPIPSEYNPYPIMTHYINTNQRTSDDSNKLNGFVTTSQALIGLNEPECEMNDLSQRGYSKAKWMGKHCQGQNEIDMYGLAPTIRSEHHGNIEFRRLSKEHGGSILDELNKGLIERRLTIRECARIQTFPDDYEFVIDSEDKNQRVSVTDAYKLVGNAVPPLLSFHIAKRLEDIWDKLFIGGNYGNLDKSKTENLRVYTPFRRYNKMA